MRRAGSAIIRFAGLSAPRQLLVGLSVRGHDGSSLPDSAEADPLHRVFTRAERLRSGAGRTLQHWAGRLAAKHAVLRLLAVEETAEHLGQVEVLPQPSPMCAANTACLHGHPPRVRFTEALAGRVAERGDEQIRVSISHTQDTALSVAIASARLPEDHHYEAA